MELTDEELDAVYDILYDEYFYGRELSYQNTTESKAVSGAMDKIGAEIEERRARR